MTRRCLVVSILCASLAPGGARAADPATAPAAASATAPAAGIPRSFDAKEFPNYQLVNEQLAVGGQPTLETLGRLKQLGFRTVINLRPESEGPAEEPAILAKQGIEFVRIPVTPATLSRKDAEAVAAVLADPDSAPVLLHCSTSNRVGGVWALIESGRGTSADTAVEAGKKLGMAKPELIEVVRKLLAEPK